MILAGTLVRLGLATAEPSPVVEPSPVTPRRPLPALILSGPAVLGLVAATLSFAPFQVERLVSHAGLPLPGTLQPSPRILDLPTADLDRMRAALGAALQIQPDWAEGHLRLGQTYLGLYHARTEELIAPQLNDPERAAIMADPLWLLGHFKTEGGGQSPVPIKVMLEQEPIRLYLVPAAALLPPGSTVPSGLRPCGSLAWPAWPICWSTVIPQQTISRGACVWRGPTATCSTTRHSWPFKLTAPDRRPVLAQEPGSPGRELGRGGGQLVVGAAPRADPGRRPTVGPKCLPVRRKTVFRPHEPCHPAVIPPGGPRTSFRGP